MIPWTDTARHELEHYFGRVRSSMEHSGADPSEVVEDLRRHIDHEITTAGLQAVTEQDLKRILQRLGMPEPEVNGNAAPPLAANGAPVLHEETLKPSGIFLVLMGVALPVFTLGVEWLTGMCAAVFFDPLPTPWHILLVAIVVIANLGLWMQLRSQIGAGIQKPLPAWIAIWNGLATGIALYYTILFAPLLPAAVFTLLIAGLGLLPLAPLLALVACLRLRKDLFRANPGLAGGTRWWLSLAVGALAGIGFQAPDLVTRAAMQMANSESADTRLRSVRWLRWMGHEETMLRACYGRTVWAGRMDLIALLTDRAPILPGTARDLYYRVTGRPFNAVPPPVVYTARGRWTEVQEEFTWDNDTGGTAVAGRVKGLSLSSSRQDGLIDSTGCVAYVEWILEFQNASAAQREARAQVALPHGGVVSRLTLWINGEEREAAFAGRTQVREAYQKVVQRRRDPVLVTTCGPDCVLLQCFPVPPQGRMKLRLGITAPLVMQDQASGIVQLPHFLERNFTLPPEMRHSIWLQASGTGQASFLHNSAQPGPPGTAVHTELSDAVLGTGRTIQVRRAIDSKVCWTPDPRHQGRMVRQVANTTQVLPATRIVLAVDGSAGMQSALPELAEAFRSIPDGMDVGVLIAGDTLVELVAPGPSTSARREETSRALRQLEMAGGQNNIPSLVRAWDLAAASPRGVVVWIHASQPYAMAELEQLKQRMQWHNGTPWLYDLPVQPGPNRIKEALDGFAGLRFEPRLGGLRSDLERLFKTLASTSQQVVFNREQIDLAAPPSSQQVARASGHIARLWASDEVARLAAAKQPAQAAALASLYQLVTLVSGAVVLETAQQYAQAGLQPVDQATVPSVPEPSTALLFGVCIALFLLWHYGLRRKVSALSFKRG